MSILKIVDKLIEKAGFVSVGELHLPNGLNKLHVAEMLSKRIEKLQNSKNVSCSATALSKENEILFLRNILKRIEDEL